VSRRLLLKTNWLHSRINVQRSQISLFRRKDGAGKLRQQGQIAPRF